MARETSPAIDAEPTTAVVDVLIPVAVDTAYSYRDPPTLMLKPGDVVTVPLGPRETVGVVWAKETVAAGGGSNLKSVSARHELPPVREPMRGFMDWLARWTLAPRGMVLRMALRAPEFAGPEPLRLVVRRAGPPPARQTPARLRVLEALGDAAAMGKSDLAAAAQCSLSVIDGLVSEGTLAVATLPPEPVEAHVDPEFRPPRLEPSQSEAARLICSDAAARRFSTTLLEGVTGSGKTDVYFEAVATALRAGRQVLILLPEIALTTQFLDRFAGRFGARPAEWHSGVSARRRARIWAAVSAGEVRVVAGARSSLFLPFADLGLLVVDEEHEAAYKQEEGVTYHARDMAVVRGRFETAAVILASATPSLESRVNAEEGRYRHVRLPHRIGGRRLPELAAVDLRLTPPPRGRWIAPPLAAAVREAIGRGEQALLFLNRRGYAPLTLCRHCGHRLHCPNCSTWLVEHRFRQVLLCHHCGHAERKPDQCPTCHQADSLVPCGPGVERLAEEAANLFPDVRMIVLSSDAPGGAEALRAQLGMIAQGEVDLVIGTQLVAKGHNFPQLTLVGVIDADVGLANGDPRAAERTFQLLQQVTGRAGRGDRPGRGLIQTWDPAHPVIRALVSSDSDRFYAIETEQRRQAGLPPFGRLAAVIVSGTDRSAAEIHARALARTAHALLAADRNERVTVFGPAEAPIFLLRGRYRFRLLAMATRSVDLQAFLRNMLADAPRPRGNLRVDVDVDPQSFL